MTTLTHNSNAVMAKLKPSDRTVELLVKALMVLLAAILIVSAIITVFPFIWSALLSTRDRSEIFGTGISFASEIAWRLTTRSYKKSCLSGRRCLTLSTWPLWAPPFHCCSVAWVVTLLQFTSSRVRTSYLACW